MSRRAQLIFLLVGVGLFALLIAQTGPARLLADMRQSGWVVLPSVLVYAVAYAFSSEAWRLSMHTRPPRISRVRAWVITAWGYALNYVTPLVSVGGEPFKIVAATQWLGKREAASSVINQRLLHVQAHLLFFLTGVVLAWALLPRAAVGTVALSIVALVLLAAGSLVVLGHRRGGVTWLLVRAKSLPFIRRKSEWLESKRSGAEEIDRQITGFYHDSPRRYVGGLALEFAARCLSVVELMLIAAAIGVPVDYWTAFLITSFASLAVNLMFFLPFALGAREGGLYVIFALLGLPPSLGVVTSMMGRLREMSWIAIGLGLGMLTRRQSSEH